MINKVQKQIYVEIQPITFHNDDPMNNHLDNTGKIIVALQPKSTLKYVAYKISEENTSTPFNLLIRLKQNKWRRINVMNHEKWTLWCSKDENEIQLKILLYSIIHGDYKLAKTAIK